MVRQLVRRAQVVSPLPYHRTQGLTRHQMLDVAFDHLDLDGREREKETPHPFQLYSLTLFQLLNSSTLDGGHD